MLENQARPGQKKPWFQFAASDVVRTGWLVGKSNVSVRISSLGFIVLGTGADTRPVILQVLTGTLPFGIAHSHGFPDDTNRSTNGPKTAGVWAAVV